MKKSLVLNPHTQKKELSDVGQILTALTDEPNLTLDVSFFLYTTTFALKSGGGLVKLWHFSLYLEHSREVNLLCLL